MRGFQAGCAPAVTDSNGTIALANLNIFEPANAAVHFLRPDGSLVAENTSTNAELIGQLSGFEGAVLVRGRDPGLLTTLRVWDTSGKTVAEGPARNDVTMLAENPLGGIVVTIRGSSGTALESYDEQLNLRWKVDAPELNQRGIGAVTVDRTGQTLLLFDADPRTAPMAVDAMWIDRDGNKGPMFRALGKQSDWAHLIARGTQRVGSGVFFRADQWWQIDSLATEVRAAPDWLARRSFASLHMVHGGTGYAVLPNSCGDTIEVIAPSGVSCGTATFSAGSGSCAAHELAVGYDGTVIERLPPPDGECTGGSCTCTWQWWPGFFR